VVRVLDVRDLRVAFNATTGPVTAVDGVSFTLEDGETLGIVGESGSGKSVTCLSIIGLLQGAAVSGEIRFRDLDLLAIERSELRRLRGGSIGMIFQDPLSSLNPYQRVGDQIVEAVRVHQRVSRRAARERAIDLLDRVGIPSPTVRVDDWPHEFSGGMRQRVMIAMALSNDPALLIADEPTTALDVSVQAQILELLGRLKDEFGIAVLLVTHNLAVVAGVADRIMVMYAGKQVETGDRLDIFRVPCHPYTMGLLASIPRDFSDARPRHRRMPSIGGRPPSIFDMPPGCRFHPRCPHAMEVCRTVEPDLELAGPGHAFACHLDAEQRSSARMAVEANGAG
jgi:oligopeptide/dipeptide ABC transporter ATP-binding protein